jgi:hypothetical protein
MYAGRGFDILPARVIPLGFELPSAELDRLKRAVATARLALGPHGGVTAS